MAHISWSEVRDRAIRFSREWAGASSESAEKQTFWNEFFEVFGLRRRSVATFEEPVQRIQGTYGKIDLFWPGIVLVEHKSLGEDLGVATSQAFAYIRDLTREGRGDEVPRFVIVSDFAKFVLYDLEPEEQGNLPLWDRFRYASTDFILADLHRNVRHFAFLRGERTIRVDPEDPANQKAYDLMCQLHDELQVGGFTGHQLEKLLVRILFCLFGEDTGLFEANAFQAFVLRETREDGSDLGARLNEFFDVLNTPNDRRSPNLGEELAQFPYVNGELFAERLGFPQFNRAMRDKLLQCSRFQWAKISPAVFGSLFQGILNREERRQHGAQYTSERDIMKVLRSLFLDDLRDEFLAICADRSTRRRGRLEEFHSKLRSLNVFDPACGCGNFLVLAYRELRLIELDLLRELHSAQTRVLNIRDLIRVDVDQFHGIEISAWPVEIARVALWLLDHQMNQRVSEAFGQYFQRLPLRSTPHIIVGNALRLEWPQVLAPTRCSYILGNPPFVGHQWRNADQQDDMARVWGETGRFGRLDYVTCWFRRAAEYIAGTAIPVAFVATNSISQGEQVGILWGDLFSRNMAIDFAHRTFNWTSEAREAAQVDVVIIGFSLRQLPMRRLYDYDADPARVQATVTEYSNINPYLVAGSNVILPSRTNPRPGFPQMKKGSQPTDGGHLILTEAERTELLREEPDARNLLRPFVGGDELIQSTHRWCLWLKDVPPESLRQLPRVMERIQAVRESRLLSPTPHVRDFAAYPTLFTQDRQPESDFIAVPEVSSENRRYIPIAFLPPTVVASNKLQIIVGGTAYHFGVLMSAMHMAWVRVVAGRLESRLSYAPSVYNNFPWPNPTPAQEARVEEEARAVLAARQPHMPPRGMGSLADLYDPLTMPEALVRAHSQLDDSVDRCYRAEPFHSDRDRVEFLFRLYEQLATPLLPTPRRQRVRRSIVTRSRISRSPRGETPPLADQS